jgi:hypothetical protein
MSLQTTLGGEVDLAEGQFLLEHMPDSENLLIYRVRTRRPAASKTEEQNLKPR